MMKRKLFLLVVFCAGMFALWVFRLDIFQWGVNRTVHLLRNVGGISAYIEENRPNYLTEAEARIDVAGAVRATNAAELGEIRRRAIEFVWKGGLPTGRLPDEAEDVTRIAPEYGLTSARRDRSFPIRMEHGLGVSALFMETAAPFRNCLFVYHQDHNAIFLGEREWFERFLSAGCDVVSIPLPLTVGMTEPVHTTVNGRRVTLARHDDFAQIQTAEFSPIRLFLAPAVTMLNFVLAEKRTYRRIAAVGLSGGGWVTTVVAALDNRFTHAYPVAGGLPQFLLRPKGRNWGDWEAHDPALYAVVNYFELYLLGVLEPHRRAVHIFNRYDNCCYNGILTAGFSAQVEGMARRWGLGEVRFRIDDHTKAHLISATALDFIVEDFLR